MILALTPEQAEARIPELSELVIDAVASGASVGFLPPLALPEAEAYWRTVVTAIREGTRVLLVAMDGDLIQGSVQLQLETRVNGNHRAEAMKLFVHRRARRQGMGRALMAELESHARKLGRTLLLLDTRHGGEAHRLCDALGYVKFGEVPGYARSSDGPLHTTVFFYKALA